jgi:hypothetical protein
MPGLVPGIHVLTANSKKDVDGRDKPYYMHTSHRSVFTGLKKLSLFKLCIRDLPLNFPTHGVS